MPPPLSLSCAAFGSSLFHRPEPRTGINERRTKIEVVDIQQKMVPVSQLLSGDMRKPTALVHFERNMSPLEQKIMTLIIFHCQTAKKGERGFYYIRKKFIKEFLGWDESKNYPGIYEAFEGIADNWIKWNFLDADRTFESLKCRLIVSLLEPSKTGAYIGFQIHHELEPVINDPKVFAKIKLIMMALLAKPRNAYALYELFADCYSRGQKNVRISLPLLKKYLGLQDDSYPVFKDFKKWVLKPNIEAINKHTDYSVRHETYRDGRRIGGLVFHIRKQLWRPPLFTGAMREMQRYLENPGLASVDSPAPVGTSKTSRESGPEGSGKPEGSEGQAFIESIAVYGITETDAKKAIEAHGLEGAIEIRDKVLKDVELRKKNNPVKDTGAYLATCLRQGHGKRTGHEREETKRKQGEASAKRRKAELEQRLKEIEPKVDHVRKERFLSLKSSLSPKEQDHLKSEFIASVNAGEKGEAIRNDFQSRGWGAIGIAPLYHLFLQEHLLPPAIEDYREQAGRQGCDYDALKEELKKISM